MSDSSPKQQGLDVDSGATHNARKPYQRPRLETYGRVHDITDAAGSMGTLADGGSMATMNKTS